MDFGELAQTGAATLVTAMTTGAWEQIKERVVRLFGRGKDQDQEDVAAELERTLSLVRGPGSDERGALVAEAELRGQLRQRLRTDPDFAAAFQVLLEEIQEQLPQPDQPSVQQQGFATHGGTVIQAGRDVNRVSPRRP